MDKAKLNKEELIEFTNTLRNDEDVNQRIESIIFILIKLGYANNLDNFKKESFVKLSKMLQENEIKGWEEASVILFIDAGISVTLLKSNNVSLKVARMALKREKNFYIKKRVNAWNSGALLEGMLEDIFPDDTEKFRKIECVLKKLHMHTE